jgi:hypothetical protein
MKKVLFSLFFLSVLFCFSASGYDFSALQGFQTEKGIFLEMSGYDIYIGYMKGSLDKPKTVASYKKKFKLEGIQAEYSSPQFTLTNIVIECEEVLKNNPNISGYATSYLFNHGKDSVVIFQFATLNQRDILLEQTLIEAFFKGDLDTYISLDLSADNISFVGRDVKLGSACRWRGPHNLYCDGGQISWSEFSSYEEAGMNLDNRIAANRRDDLTVLYEEYLDVEFEDVPTVAYRVVYRGKNEYYPLIVYYIGEEIRGRFVSCVMSNYAYNRYDYHLPSLFQQFMSIPQLPEWAISEFDSPTVEALSEEEKENIRSASPSVNVSITAVKPLENLNQIFSVAKIYYFFKQTSKWGKLSDIFTC